MIYKISTMQTLEIKEDLYERFLKFKLKHKPNLSDEDFIEFLMNQFENNYCSKIICNGYTNGLAECPDLEPEVFESAPMESEMESNINNNNNENPKKADILSDDFKKETSIKLQVSACPECKFSSGNRSEIEKHFNEYHDMNGTFPCTCGQCFNNLSRFLAHYIVCPIAATDLQHNSFAETMLDENYSVQDEEKDEDVTPIIQSREPSPIDNEDSNDKPLDFHLDSPSYSNPLNLVKHENMSVTKESLITDYSINAINFDHINASSNEKPRLPENLNINNTSSISASPPGNPDHSKKPCKVYECDHCEKNFKSKGLLDQHKHLHFPPRHECEFCGRRFRWPPQFYTHKQQCSKRKLIITDPSDPGSLKKHNYNFAPTTCTYNHTDGRQSQPGMLFSQVTEQCLCGFKSSVLTDIYEHKRSCIASARAMILQKIIDYKSIQTSSLFPNMQAVNGNHLSSSPSVHSVLQNFMPNATTNTSVLSTVNNMPPVTTTAATNQGQQKLHEEKPFECDFCESRFMTKISLKQHLDGKHSDQAKYCCEKCGKGYFWNASYNYHKKKCNVKPLLNLSGLN